MNNKILFIFLMIFLVSSVSAIVYSNSSLLNGEGNLLTDQTGTASAEKFQWLAQTFTITNSLTATNIYLKLGDKAGTLLPTTNISIRAVDSTGKPTGSDLVNSNVSNTLISSGSTTWISFPLSPYSLTANTKYAIIIKGDPLNTGSIGSAFSSNSIYPYGDYFYSANQGSSWDIGDDTDDLLFLVIGNYTTIENLSLSQYRDTNRFISIPSSVSALTKSYLNLSGYSQEIGYNFEGNLNGWNVDTNSPNYSSSWSSKGLSSLYLDADSVIKEINLTGIYYIKFDTNIIDYPAQVYFAINTSAFSGCSNNLNLWTGSSTGVQNASVNLTIYTNQKRKLFFCAENLGFNDATAFFDNVRFYNQTGGFVYYNNTDINYTVSNNLNTPSVYINNTDIWTYTGNFNQTNNRTINFASYVNQYINSNYLIGSYYYIPYSFVTIGAGILQYSSMLFSNEGFLVNSATYSSSDYETSNSTFVLNITYDTNSYTTSSANLIYNGTSYSTTQSVSGSNSIFTRSINLPIVRSSGSQDINSFYWEVLLSNSSTTSYFNSSTYTQTVLKTDIVICNITYQNYSLINLTTKSATSPYPNKNATMRITWDWNLGNGTSSVQRNSSYQDLSEGNYTWAFCGTVDANYTIDAQIQYDATGYAINNYYLDDALLIPNQTNRINLYLLNDTLATLTEFLVQNPAQQGIEDVIIQVQMYDVGLDQFFLVSMMKTSYAGTDISYLNWYDTFYKYILIQDGTVIASTNSSKISDTPQTFTIFQDSVFTFDKFRDFQYSLTYNNATQNFVLTYTKPSGLVTAACLRVIKRSIGNDTTLSTQCNSAASGTIYYNIGNDGNGTFIASFYATGSIYPVDWITATIGEGLSDAINILLGDDAPVYAILFAAVTLGATFFNPVFGVIAIVLSILGAGALGFSLISYGVYIGIVLIGGIIILFIRR